MLTKSVTYTNYDDEVVTKELNFNLSRVELTEQLHLVERLQTIQDTIFAGPKREMTPIEIQAILDTVKLLMKLSYGIREDDRFVKSEEVWEHFTQTMAYDEFLFSLFENPETAVEFMVEIMPRELRDDVRAKVEEAQAELAQPTELKSSKKGQKRGTPDLSSRKVQDNQEPRIKTRRDVAELTADELRDWVLNGGNVNDLPE